MSVQTLSRVCLHFARQIAIYISTGYRKEVNMYSNTPCSVQSTSSSGGRVDDFVWLKVINQTMPRTLLSKASGEFLCVLFAYIYKYIKHVLHSLYWMYIKTYKITISINEMESERKALKNMNFYSAWHFLLDVAACLWQQKRLCGKTYSISNMNSFFLLNRLNSAQTKDCDFICF